MPDSAQKLWQIAFAGETIKAQCFETVLKVFRCRGAVAFAVAFLVHAGTP